MKNCIEHTRVEDGQEITLFIRDDNVVSKRVKSKEFGYDVERWWYRGDKIYKEYWRRDGKKHRDDDLPAVICYSDGQKTKECWYRDGMLPAMIWYENGQKTDECLIYEGQYHPLLMPHEQHLLF